MSRIFRVRLPHSLDEQLTQVCEATRLPVSTAIRSCVKYVLNHPEAWEIFQRASPYSLVDIRTEDEKAAYAAYERKMEAFDLNKVAQEIGLV